MEITKAVEVIQSKRFLSWWKLIRVTAYVLKFISSLREAKEETRNSARTQAKLKDCMLSPQELEKAEMHGIKESQKGKQDRLRKGDFQTLTPFLDGTGIIRVGGRAEGALVSYEMKHPTLLLREHGIAMLIVRQMHEEEHSVVVTTMAKTRAKYWIIRAHDLAKTVKFRCTCWRQIEAKLETQIMANVPKSHIQPFTPPFYNTSCDYFGPYQVKVRRNKTAKHYGVIFTCLITRAVHLELAVDCSTMEFLQTLRRFFAIRRQPAAMMSDNGTQFVGAERELKEIIYFPSLINWFQILIYLFQSIINWFQSLIRWFQTPILLF